MTVGAFLIYIAAAFSNALPSFIYAARQSGWRHGSMFHEQKIPNFVSLGCIGAILGRLVAAYFSGQVGLLYCLSVIPAWLIGGMVVIYIFKKNAGIVSLVAAPLLTASTIFIKL